MNKSKDSNSKFEIRNSKLRIAFILSQFPCYDEMFILREIYALSKKEDILIVSLKNAKDPVVHDQAAELLPKTIYVPYFFSDLIFWSHLKTLIAKPFVYLRALLGLISGNLKNPEFLFKSLLFFPKAVYLAQRLKQEGVTNIHAYWATYPASVALIISELSGIPYSFTGHAHDIYLDTTYLRQKMMRAAFITTCTQTNKEHLMKVAPLYSERRILVNYHGLELNQFYVNGKARNKTFQILSVGTLNSHKGFQYLIQALAHLKEKGLQFNGTLVGGGPLESELKKQISALQMEPYIKMTGPLKQSDVLSLYKAVDLMVLMAQPEWHWGIPNVLIEALAAKTPVITTQFGSVHELVKDQETGLIVAPKDSQALAAAMDRLYHNDVLRRELAEAGYQIVAQRFDLEKNLEQFKEKFAKYAAYPLVS